ncbi:MAG: hypothetical protein AAGH76_02795 [Pseudomonadota bacterium]
MSDRSDGLPERLARPRQLTELTQDQTVAALLRLAMEVAVLRDRLRTQEQLLVKHGVLSDDEIDSFAPDADEQAQRLQTKTDLIERLISDLSE